MFNEIEFACKLWSLRLIKDQFFVNSVNYVMWNCHIYITIVGYDALYYSYYLLLALLSYGEWLVWYNIEFCINMFVMYYKYYMPNYVNTIFDVTHKVKIFCVLYFIPIVCFKFFRINNNIDSAVFHNCAFHLQYLVLTFCLFIIIIGYYYWFWIIFTSI